MSRRLYCTKLRFSKHDLKVPEERIQHWRNRDTIESLVHATVVKGLTLGTVCGSSHQLWDTCDDGPKTGICRPSVWCILTPSRAVRPQTPAVRPSWNVSGGDRSDESRRWQTKHLCIGGGWDNGRFEEYDPSDAPGSPQLDLDRPATGTRGNFGSHKDITDSLMMTAE
ncbi:uncharacterized protein BO72DRAFT_502401 [Aspergillus fijiensis CBS 313.89]|uniref:Uncharacterized protein n=1 Tax=Aspergillus fijiensis CBS 313.89 TaxID=1448319 RepID=A0A8G1VS69_9EURO|nr:uncharacterized protein BO72DRAFT_502401 [Aspergillus fijiensis CBS 313.89]RAK70935.1 hypothetical protein BO72DRAFT_502401 [Aspergillus fijiensis CBS 313.89]